MATFGSPKTNYNVVKLLFGKDFSTAVATSNLPMCLGRTPVINLYKSSFADILQLTAMALEEPSSTPGAQEIN